MHNNYQTNPKAAIRITQIKWIIRSVLLLSTGLILTSSFLRILCGSVTFQSYNLIYSSVPYYSFLISILALLASVPGLILICLLDGDKQGIRWKLVEKEIFLLAITIVCVALFILIVKA